MSKHELRGSTVGPMSATEVLAGLLARFGDLVDECHAPDSVTAALVARGREVVASKALAPAPTLEPRRTVGAVVKGSVIDVEFIVVADNEVRRVSNGNKQTSPLFDFDTFVRWATREECERHDIPFVDRAPPACHGECGTEAPGRCSTGCAPDERPTPPAPAPTVAPLTEAERVDLADAMRRARAGHASVCPWDRLDTYDKKSALDRADAAAAWFQRRGSAS